MSKLIIFGTSEELERFKKVAQETLDGTLMMAESYEINTIEHLDEQLLRILKLQGVYDINIPRILTDTAIIKTLQTEVNNILYQIKGED